MGTTLDSNRVRVHFTENVDFVHSKAVDFSSQDGIVLGVWLDV
jgi:hypothetical protein